MSAEASERLQKLKERYPDPKSTVMAALYLVQEEHEEITNEGVHWVSEQTGISPVHVMELVTFYTMYRRKKLGKYHVQVCRTLSCGLCGAKDLMSYLHERLHVEPGEITADGIFSYEYVECLGSCGTAPMCEINDTYFENLTPEKLKQLLDRIEREKPDLSLSTKRDAIGSGLTGEGYSKVLGDKPL
ncbi:MAG: NADH-quinone oxidoreductase subunit NuoE [Bdellovibrionales bacterium]|nr:NADH-quinone oxidoreductase subunit NuoE [Bdellovibrionales bacterium]